MDKLPIKVLYVEDETIVLYSLVEILRRRVKEVIPAINGKEGLELYHKHHPDVVITDINMPEMNGLQMARRMKSVDPEIDVYLLSAYPQPDYLLEAIDIGVKGFLKKPLDIDKLFRILEEISEPEILRKRIRLDEKDREAMQSALLDSEIKFQTIFNNLNDAIFVHGITDDNKSSKIIEVNDSAVNLFGYTKDELLTMTPADLDDNTTSVRENDIISTLKKERHFTFNNVFVSKRGKKIPVEISSHILARNGKDYVISIIRDVSERKKYEDELRFHSHVLQNLYDSVVITDLKGTITYVNDAVAKILKHKKEELLGKHIAILSENTHDSLAQDDILKLVLEKGYWNGQVINVTADGEKVLFDSHIWVLKDSNGRPSALVSISHDVTKERKKEEQLRESEEKFRTLAENLPGIVYIYEIEPKTEERKMIYVGPGFEEMVGKDFANKIGNDANQFFDHVHPDDFKTLQEIAENSIKNNEPLNHEYRIQADSGDVIWVRTISRGTYKENGNILWQGVLINVTEQRENEQKIRESERLYRDLFENANDIIWISDNKAILKKINRQFKDILGYTTEDLLSKKIHDIIIEEDKQKSIQYYKEALSGNTVEYEARMLSVDERERTIWINLRPIFDNDKITEIQAVGRDITIQKNIVQQLRESENKYRSLYNSLHDMIMLHGIENDGTLTNFVEVNDEVIHKLGYSRNELYNMTLNDIRVPPSSEYSRNKKHELLQTHSVLFETVLKCKDGSRIPVEIHSRIINVDSKKQVLAIARDISERKKTQELIKQKEEFSTTLFEYNPVETIVVDKQGKIVRFNKALQEARSRPPKIGDVMYKDYANKHEKDMYAVMMKAIKTGEQVVIPDSQYKNDSGVKHWHITIAPFPQGAIITGWDITRQIEAEKQLKDEVEQKELLIREINHRVKNNFAIVSSLLNIQKQNIEDDDIRIIFDEAQNRIESIGLVHKKLYSSSDLAHIDFSDYITALILQLLASFELQKGHIELDLNIKEVTLDISKAIPCGLIINELITNAFKHGFAEGKEGKITVIMHYKDNDEIELIIANDGEPFPKEIDFTNTQTLGLQLVTSLVQQIDGEIELDTSKGTKFSIKFNKNL
ncbi:MAG TPA: response regulator [Candidatus Cloacimonetes bacterium]|nr:response regulator [Candidatus Cloacimonadota bacterium]HEX38031.1 response regulator [Candidatus Cloacimonadota bacterium]